MSEILYSVTAALEEALSSAPDTWAESEKFVGSPPVNDDVLDVDLHAMLSEGTREWDTDGIFEKLLSRPSWLINRYQDKVWRLAQLMDFRYAPDSAVDSMLTLLGFGFGQGKATLVADSLSATERRMLVKIAAKFWRLRGRHDVLSTAIMFLTYSVRPRIIPWKYRATRVGNLIVGVTDAPNADLGMVITEHFVPLSESDAQVTLLRVMDAGSLNRVGVEAICELARPSHEIFEISYVSFLDTFLDGRLSYWVHVGGAEVTYLSGDGRLPGAIYQPNTMEYVAAPQAEPWGNITLSFVVEITADSEIFALVSYKNVANYWKIQITPATGVPLVTVITGGVVVHATPNIDLAYDVPAQVGVQIDIEVGDANTWVKVKVDGETMGEELLLGRVSSGSIGFSTDGSGDDVRLMSVEVFEHPMDRVILGPDGREEVA